MLEKQLNGEDFDWDYFQNEKRTKKRILLKIKKKISESVIPGIVITTKGRYFFVKKINVQDPSINKCVVSGSIEINHNHKSLVTVGDRCEFIPPIASKDGTNLGRIVKVNERKTFLMRKSVVSNKEDIIASNMDKVLVLLSVKNPPYNLWMLDKILVACEFGGVEPIICINKIDIAYKDNIQNDFLTYSKLGYKVLFISALKLIGLENLSEIIKNNETLFLGVSGVGKSTLVNSLLGRETQKVGILTKNLRGRHTTTSCFYINLSTSTAIIDSPGFREFDLFGISKDELQFYFPDFEPYFQKCKFQPCSHTHEPKCAIKNAIKRGRISSQRYASYLSIYENL